MLNLVLNCFDKREKTSFECFSFVNKVVSLGGDVVDCVELNGSFLQERFQAAALISVNRANWLTRLGTNTLVYTANMFTGSPSSKEDCL